MAHEVMSGQTERHPAFSVDLEQLEIQQSSKEQVQRKQREALERGHADKVSIDSARELGTICNEEVEAVSGKFRAPRSDERDSGS